MTEKPDRTDTAYGLLLLALIVLVMVLAVIAVLLYAHDLGVTYGWWKAAGCP